MSAVSKHQKRVASLIDSTPMRLLLASWREDLKFCKERIPNPEVERCLERMCSAFDNALADGATAEVFVTLDWVHENPSSNEYPLAIVSKTPHAHRSEKDRGP